MLLQSEDYHRVSTKANTSLLESWTRLELEERFRGKLKDELFAMEAIDASGSSRVLFGFKQEKLS